MSVRNALHLAVDSENIEMIELLLDKLGFDGIEEALLHTISKGHTKIVKARHIPAAQLPASPPHLLHSHTQYISYFQIQYSIL